MITRSKGYVRCGIEGQIVDMNSKNRSKAMGAEELVVSGGSSSAVLLGASSSISSSSLLSLSSPSSSSASPSPRDSVCEPLAGAESPHISRCPVRQLKGIVYFHLRLKTFTTVGPAVSQTVASFSSQTTSSISLASVCSTSSLPISSGYKSTIDARTEKAARRTGE